jgi:hypothetical protein
MPSRTDGFMRLISLSINGFTIGPADRRSLVDEPDLGCDDSSLPGSGD